MTSDFTKHPETADIAIKVGLSLAARLFERDSVGDLRRAIELVQYADWSDRAMRGDRA